MAKCDIKLPDGFLSKLTRLGSRTDEVSERVLEAGGEVMLTKVKGALSSVVGRATKTISRSTGELERSLGLSPVKLDKNGNHNVKIGFSEPRSDSKSNAMLASILEYGKHGQPARPFLKPAKTSAKAACEAAMKAKFEEEVGSL